ncbi:hypothetical protein BS78_07G088100 [Paspalum vaginatum]|nr:hypothetical protein BS78_07G088100 [Paspalum vaginatum]
MNVTIKDTSHQWKHNCGKCGRPGHNRMVCGCEEKRFNFTRRICEKCGEWGHYGILCTNESASNMIPTESHINEGDDLDPGSPGGEVRGDTSIRTCKWHMLKKKLGSGFLG